MMLSRSPTTDFRIFQTAPPNEDSEISQESPKTTEKIEELVALFDSKPQVIDAIFWKKFGDPDLSLEIQDSNLLCDRVHELADETWKDDDKRIILIPGGLYTSSLKSWPLGGFKAPKIDCRKGVCISSILTPLRQSIFGSFQSRLAANF